MILCMLRRLLGFVICFALSGPGVTAWAQGVTAIIERDIRVFAVTAALNAAGFDVELAPQYHPVRQQVREHVANLDENLETRLREFYRKHKGDALDATQYAKYVSLALNLTDPPSLEVAHDEFLIPLDARELADFLPLLREFYQAARISQLWSVLSATYDESLDRMVPPFRDTIIRSDAYLKVPLGSSSARQLVIFLELSAPVNSVNVRNYPENLYIVLGDSIAARVDDVRHAYLHLLIDPMVAANRLELVRSRRLASLIEGVDGVREEYVDDFEILLTESLIRAVELRMERAPSEDVGELLDAAYRRGLLLVLFFYEELEGFEVSETGIREYFPGMIQSLDVDSETARFEERFATITLGPEVVVRAEVPPPPPNPVQQILRQAQEAFNAGADETARSAFERILSEFEPANGPALYGMALIASREEDADLARDYFTRTIESDSAEPSMRVWSHIFLGRIHDIECEREAAVAAYESAVGLGDDTRGAQTAARQGIAEPFGGGCGFR